jgi:hypothetical protein
MSTITKSRQAMCNVLTNQLIELADFNGELDRKWAEAKLRAGGHCVDVAGDDYPRHWTRWDDVYLSDAEVAYCLREFDAWAAAEAATASAART